MYHHKPGKYSSGVKWKKDNKPAPTTYENAAAREKSAVMKSSIKHLVPKSKDNNYIQSTLKNKRHVPGVGSYKTLESYKQLSSSVTSLKMRRH